MTAFAAFNSWSGTEVCIRKADVIKIQAHPKDGDRPNDPPSCHLELAHSKSTVRVRGELGWVLDQIQGTAASRPESERWAERGPHTEEDLSPRAEQMNRIIDCTRFAGTTAVLVHRLDSQKITVDFYNDRNERIEGFGGDYHGDNDHSVEVTVPEGAVKAIVVKR